MSSLSFDFPQPLSEKYQPKAFDQFIGLNDVKTKLSGFAKRPRPCNFFFLGPSGTGKTSMAFTLARAIRGEVHHIASKECTLETVRETMRQCWMMPRDPQTWEPLQFHVVICDEADQMSFAAQQGFLSILDATDRPPNTVIVFTGNAVSNLEDRFLSRCLQFKFSSYGMAKEIAGLLQNIWTKETDNPVEMPDFARIAKDSANNVRDALMCLEVAIMGV